MVKDETNIESKITVEDSNVDEDQLNKTNDAKAKIDTTELTHEEEIIKLKDKVTRLYAEMENQRRRYDKEKDEAFEYGGFNFARETLSLLDNLERSKISLENDESLKGTDAIKKILEHIDIICKDINSIFKKNGIEPIRAINEKLDPNFHQAMMEIEDSSKKPGTIVQEIQKGFLMKERLLRPSLVGVSKKKEDENAKSEENEGKKDEN